MSHVEEEFPSDLLDVYALERVIAFIRALPLTSTQKKRKLGEWASYLGVRLGVDYYTRVGGGVKFP